MTQREPIALKAVAKISPLFFILMMLLCLSSCQKDELESFGGLPHFETETVDTKAHNEADRDSEEGNSTDSDGSDDSEIGDDTDDEDDGEIGDDTDDEEDGEIGDDTDDEDDGEIGDDTDDEVDEIDSDQKEAPTRSKVK